MRCDPRQAALVRKLPVRLRQLAVRSRFVREWWARTAMRCERERLVPVAAETSATIG